MNEAAGMKGYEIAHLLEYYPLIFKQLLNIVKDSHIPPSIPIGQFLVVNTSSHWVTLHHSQEFGYELFDSLGLNSGFIKKLPKSYLHLTTNVTQIQSSSSSKETF